MNTIRGLFIPRLPARGQITSSRQLAAVVRGANGQKNVVCSMNLGYRFGGESCNLRVSAAL